LKLVQDLIEIGSESALRSGWNCTEAVLGAKFESDRLVNHRKTALKLYGLKSKPALNVNANAIDSESAPKLL